MGNTTHLARRSCRVLTAFAVVSLALMLAAPGAQPVSAQSRLDWLGIRNNGSWGWRGSPGVSSDGSIVVGTDWNGTTSTPVMWTEAGGLVDLNVAAGTSLNGRGVDVSDDGNTVLVFGVDPRDGFVWTDSGGYTSLGFDPYAMSDDGKTIVGQRRAGNTWEAVRWSASGGIQGLGDLPGGNSESYAYAVSDDGATVLGASRAADNLFRAFTWTSAGGMTELPALAGYLGHCQANGVSTSGSIAVGSCNEENGPGRAAVRWTTGTAQSIGTFGALDAAYARFISADGSITVGFVTGSPTGWFVSENGGSPREVQDLWANDYGIDLEGMQIREITDVSDDGTVFVGYAYNAQGETEAFRVVADPCSRLVGKRSAECECTVEEFVLTGEGEFIEFAEASNWDRNSVPDENSLLVLPQRSDTFVVVADNPVGEVEVEGDVVLLNSLTSDNFHMVAPCGDALVIMGRSGRDDPGSFLEIQAAEATVSGNIIVPGRADSYGDLALSTGTIVSDVAMVADLGNYDSSAEVTLEAGSEWLTPAGSVRLRNGTLRLDDESTMQIARLDVGETVLQDGFALLSVERSSLVDADSVFVGINGFAGATVSNSTLRAKYLETASTIGAAADVVVTNGAVMDILTATIGRRDTSSVAIDTTSFFVVAGGLILGDESGSLGVATVEGYLGTTEELTLIDVGNHGDGEIEIKNGGDVVASVMTLGVEEGGFGLVTMLGLPAKQEPDLDATLLSVGMEGEGFVVMHDGWIKAIDTEASDDPSAIVLGNLPAGEGTIEMHGVSELDVNRLIVGQEGRGDMKVMDESNVEANLIVIGDSIRAGGFGSMNVSGSSFVYANGICVGCIDGVGLLGVIENGTVWTNILQIGPKGSVQGPIATVRRVVSSPNRRHERRAGKHGGRANAGIVTGALYLSAEATIDVDTLTIEDGTLGGSFTWPDDFTNIGTISPGDGPETAGTFSFAANFSQTADGTLDIELGGLTPGSEHDVLAVQGTATLAGTLNMSRLDGFVPSVGDEFTILTAGSVEGRFDSIVAGDVVVALRYEGNSVVAQVVSSVDVEEVGTQPTQFVLEPNYPNPFGAQTTISYVLPENEDVLLTVYDLYGRRVHTLVNTRQTAGRHEVAFDASGLASGVYLYQFQAGNYSASRRMVVRK